MRALRDLRQLVRVAEQDERARGGADREHVGERDLARLVDEEHVDRPLGRVEVDRLAGQRPAVPATSSKRRVGAGVGVGRRDDAAARRTPCPGRPRRAPSSRPLNVKPCRSASCSIARSRLWIALWLSEVTPTRLPARISATAIFAPCQVLPDPGGPCTKR